MGSTQVIITMTKNGIKLHRILQLCSANLPVGGFSFSQGLEYAVEEKWVHDLDSTEKWVELNLLEAIAKTDLPIMQRMYKALEDKEFEKFTHWHDVLMACRESKELLLAETAMGKALLRLLNNMRDTEEFVNIHTKLGQLGFVGAFTLAAYLWEISLSDAQYGYCWTYIDNQVAAATKLVPLGQTDAQNGLFALTETIDEAMNTSGALHDNEIGASLPRVAMASSWHETQYSRLFRS